MGPLPAAACGLLGRCDLIAVDLDGTTLDTAGRVSARTVDAWHAAVDAGLVVLPVSGRPLSEVRALAAAHGLGGWACAANGAVITDLASARPARRDGFGPEAAHQVVRALRAGAPDLALGAVAERVVALDPAFPAELARAWDDPPCARVERVLTAHPILDKIIAVHPDGVTAAEDAARRALVTEDVAITRSSDEFLELSPRSVHKGQALRWVAQRHGIAPARCAAVGDMPNDLTMLAAAGLALAVANAHPRVLAAAHHVVPSHDHDGVAAVLEAAVHHRDQEVGR